MTDDDQAQNMIMVQQMTTLIGTLLNAFADMATAMRQRLVAEGWSEDSAEALVLATTAPMIGLFMARIASPSIEPTEGEVT